MFSDVGHLEVEGVNTSFHHRASKGGFMQLGATGCNDYSVKFVFGDVFFDDVLPLFGTGEQLPSRIDYMGQIFSIFSNCWDIDDFSDVCTALTDKHSDAWFFDCHCLNLHFSL
jgi:hypothetical protein